MSEERKNWTKLDDRLLQKTRVFDLRVQRMRSPDESYEDDFFYIQTLDWVNVIPITPEGDVIFVEQYRHGINERTLETPGGLVDPGSTPRQTAEKELAEETGYSSPRLTLLGTIHPNPAMLTNQCHIFLAENAERTHVQELEPAEDIILHSFPLVKIPHMIASGAISHAVVVAAFFFVRNKLPDLF